MIEVCEGAKSSASTNARAEGEVSQIFLIRAWKRDGRVWSIALCNSVEEDIVDKICVLGDGERRIDRVEESEMRRRGWLARSELL